MTPARLACALTLAAALLTTTPATGHVHASPPAPVVSAPDLTGHPLRAAWPWTPRTDTRGPRP